MYIETFLAIDDKYKDRILRIKYTWLGIPIWVILTPHDCHERYEESFLFDFARLNLLKEVPALHCLDVCRMLGPVRQLASRSPSLLRRLQSSARNSTFKQKQLLPHGKSSKQHPRDEVDKESTARKAKEEVQKSHKAHHGSS
jgi:hypothetical protein